MFKALVRHAEHKGWLQGARIASVRGLGARQTEHPIADFSCAVPICLGFVSFWSPRRLIWAAEEAEEMAGKGTQTGLPT